MSVPGQSGRTRTFAIGCTYGHAEPSDQYFIKKQNPQRKTLPSRELYKVVLTEDKVREKGERVSLSVLCLLLFLLERVGNKQGKLTLF